MSSMKVYSWNIGKILAKININELILPILLINLIKLLAKTTTKTSFLKNRMSDQAQILELNFVCFPPSSMHTFISNTATSFCLYNPLKGALDKYNIYLFISSSIENLKSNKYRKFQLILPMRFHFMRYFVNIIIFRVPHRLLYSVFIEVDFEK